MKSSLKVLDEEILIPDRLVKAINHEENQVAETHTGGQVPFPTDIEALNEASLGQLAEVIRGSLDSQNEAEAILAIGLFAAKRSRVDFQNGDLDSSIDLLADGLWLEHQALAQVPSKYVRRLTHQVSAHTEQALEVSACFGSLEAFLEKKEAMKRCLQISETVWGPEFSSALAQLSSILNETGNIFAQKEVLQKNSIRKMMESLGKFKKTIPESQNRPQSERRWALLRDYSDSLLQLIQQEILLLANVQYSSQGLDHQSISRQAQALIGEVETRLRELIGLKYREIYGASWLEHIQARHTTMYQIWLKNLEKDEPVLNAFPSSQINMLDYAYFEHLTELISAQWQAFRDIFTFGHPDRNKAIFNDMMTQIGKVRNPLAHHRDVPENELLRARVLCTDILLELDRWGGE